MSRLAGHIAVAVCGIVTFALTVFVVALIGSATGFNIFTFGLWIVLPIGAILTGAAAASGFFFGSLLFHVRPTRWLLAQVVVLAALSQVTIYYAEYLYSDRRNDVGFLRYLHDYLTSTGLNIDFFISFSTGRLGILGYALAAIHFAGFVVGGWYIFAILRNVPACPKCNLYFRTLSSRRQGFLVWKDFTAFYENFVRHPVDSPEFAQLLLQSTPLGLNAPKGALAVQSDLRVCPRCAEQVVVQRVRSKEEKGWEWVPKLTRLVTLPAGVDLRPLFSNRR